MPALLSKIHDKVFYGWVVVAAGLIISIIGIGLRYSFGVFFKSIESEFDLTRVATSGIFSVYMVLSAVFSALGGWASDKYGPRKVAFAMGVFIGVSFLLTSQTGAFWQLFISYSLLFALGTGAIFAVANSTVSRWFKKRRGLALGISSSGGGSGGVIFAPFATYLISSFDWRWAFIILGLIAWLMMGAMSILFIKDPSDVGLLPDGVKPETAETERQNNDISTQPGGLSLRESSRTSNFWLLAFIWLFLSLSVHLILTHAVPHAIDLGISPIDASVIISLIGVAVIPGRVAGGRISDSIGRKVPAITGALLQVAILIWIIWIQELWMFYLFAVFFGFSWGSLGNQITALIGDIFGLRNIGAIMGTLVAAWAIGGAIGPAIGGSVFDVSGGYSMAFAIAAASMLIATLLAALIRPQRMQLKELAPIVPL